MNVSDESFSADPALDEATPAVLYRRSIDRGEVMPDAAQAVVIELLDHLFERAMKRQSRSSGFIKDVFGKWLGRSSANPFAQTKVLPSEPTCES